MAYNRITVPVGTLVEWYVEKKMSLAEIAKKFGVSKQAVGKKIQKSEAYRARPMTEALQNFYGKAGIEGMQHITVAAPVSAIGWIDGRGIENRSEAIRDAIDLYVAAGKPDVDTSWAAGQNVHVSFFARISQLEHIPKKKGVSDFLTKAISFYKERLENKVND